MNRFLSFLGLFLILLFSSVCFSQVVPEDSPQGEEAEEERDIFEALQQKSLSGATVSIYQDGEIQALVLRHITLNKKQGGISGYRVEIFSETGYGAKDAAENARKEFEKKYESIPAYVVWDGINFKVRIGDFRSRDEAKRTMFEISPDYPFTFMVKEMINFPKLNY